MLNNQFPYTDYHGLNLDWLLQKMKELDTKVNAGLSEEIRAIISQAVLNGTYDAASETLTVSIILPEE